MADRPLRFAIIGVGGFVAPRHLRAIKETGNVVVAALDRHDSVGVLDSYFPDAAFFTEFERFDRHLDKLARTTGGIDYTTICSPNYLHDAHIRFALRLGSNVICEKPLVLNPRNLEGLEELERETGRRVFNVLQLRLHPSIQQLKSRFTQDDARIHDIELTYITPRGTWYEYSWKGDIEKSGGVATNIGVHFFDMLAWIFGAPVHSEVHLSESKRMAGFLQLERARVRWFLSVDPSDLPPEQQGTYQAHRLITIDGEEIEFSQGFTDLHTSLYRHVLEGKGFGIPDARTSIAIVSEIRQLTTQPRAAKENQHSMLTGETRETRIN